MTANERVVQLGERMFAPGHMSEDETRRRLFLGIVTVSCMAAALPFAIYYALRGDILQGSLIFGVLLFGVLVLVFTRRQASLIPTQRLFAVLALALFGYVNYNGSGGGYAFLWFYFLPPVFFYVGGFRDGIVFSSISLAMGILLLFNFVGPGTYPPEVGPRFLATYLLVSVFAYVLEASRKFYYERLMNEKRILEQTRDELQTVTGLLPVCMGCKKVRDDSGYWNQLEDYLATKSDIRVSHGLCPECAAKMYPDFQEDEDPPRRPH